MRIYITRRAETLRNIAQWYLFGTKLIVLVTEMIGHIIYSGWIVAQQQVAAA